MIIGLQANKVVSAGVSSRKQSVATCSEEVQWLSATAVRPHSTATSTTTPGTSGKCRAAEHDAFNGEGRGLTSYHATGQAASGCGTLSPEPCGVVHLRVRTQLREATMRDHRGRAVRPI